MCDGRCKPRALKPFCNWPQCECDQFIVDQLTENESSYLRIHAYLQHQIQGCILQRCETHQLSILTAELDKQSLGGFFMHFHFLTWTKAKRHTLSMYTRYNVSMIVLWPQQCSSTFQLVRKTDFPLYTLTEWLGFWSRFDTREVWKAYLSWFLDAVVRVAWTDQK